MKKVSVRIGSYKDKTGEEKGQYAIIGSLIETEKGTCIKFDGIVANYLKALFGYKREGRANIYDKEDAMNNKNEVKTDESDEGAPF